MINRCSYHASIKEIAERLNHPTTKRNVRPDKHNANRDLLRISAVGVVLEMALIPILTTLARQHPRLTVEVHADQNLVDIVAEGYDAGIRLRRAIQQDMVTTRLTGSFKAILVASRDYLDARGTPKSIADLHQHNCIGLRLGKSGPTYDWELIDGKKQVAVKTSGTA